MSSAGSAQSSLRASTAEMKSVSVIEKLSTNSNAFELAEAGRRLPAFSQLTRRKRQCLRLDARGASKFANTSPRALRFESLSLDAAADRAGLPSGHERRVRNRPRGSIRGDEKGSAPRLRKLSERAQTPDVRLDRTREMPLERLARAAVITRDKLVEDL